MEAQAKFLVDTNQLKTVIPFESWGNPKFVEAAAKK